MGADAYIFKLINRLTHITIIQKFILPRSFGLRIDIDDVQVRTRTK
jgi:hypothetical protein